MINSNPIHILYMEDDHTLAHIIQKRLELVGYRVDLAGDGAEGLVRYDATTHNFLVIDYGLPRYNGLEVLRFLKRRGPLPPSIMLTGYDDAQIAVAAIKLGVDEYIVKDMDRDYLRLLPAVIEKVLYKRHLIQERQHKPPTRADALTDDQGQPVVTETLPWAGAVVFSDTLNYAEVLDHIVEQVGLVTTYDAVCVLLLEGETARVARWRGYKQFGAEVTIASASFKISEIASLCAVYETGLPLVVSHAETHDSWVSQSEQPWIKSYVTVPISTTVYDEATKKPDLIGFLKVDSAAPGSFNQVDAERLQAFANQAAIALHNAQLYDNARQEVFERVRALKRERNFISAILDTAGALIIILNAHGRILRHNRACEAITGYSIDEVRGKRVWDLFLPPEEIENVKAHFQQLCRGEFPVEYESHWITRTGEWRRIAWSNTILHDNTGAFEYIIWTGTDITERKQMEEALRQSEERYALAALSANDGLWDWNLITNEIYYSPRWKAMLGYPDDQIEHNLIEWFSRVHPKDLEQLKKDILTHLAGQPQPVSNEHRILHRNGTYRWALTQGLAVRDQAGQAYRMAGSLTDITERKAAEAKLVHNALHDALTDLPNRTLFRKHLEQAIARTKKTDNYLFAVLFLDLDRFKVINDSLGHMVGDQLLVAIGRRLKNCVRNQDTVARLGGDEFAVLLDDLSDVDQATQLARRIQKELNRPVDLDKHQVFTSASIGIALSTIGYDNPEDILRDADTTMYQAKAGGRARHEVFNVDMRDHAVEVWQMEAELRQALARQEFQLHYQPIVSLPAGRIVAVEALLRWYHPQRGLVTPNEFIPLAEEIGLIGAIGTWVLETACTQVKTWHKAGYGFLRLSLNVSPYQLQKRPQTDLLMAGGSALPRLVDRTLKETSFPPQALELEITESAAMLDVDYSLAILEALSKLGVRIAIDDFGMGSSLDLLRHFPINTLKIDQSFVRQMTGKRNDVAFITAIIAMAHSLNLNVIAEGLETEEQLALLNAQQCDEVQGNLFSPPLPVEALTELLQAGRLLLTEVKGG